MYVQAHTIKGNGPAHYLQTATDMGGEVDDVILHSLVNVFIPYVEQNKMSTKREGELTTKVQTLALVWPETLMRSRRLSCAHIKFEWCS